MIRIRTWQQNQTRKIGLAETRLEISVNKSAFKDKFFAAHLVQLTNKLKK